MTSKTLFATLGTCVLLAGCDLNDPTPTLATLRLEGAAGTQVTVVYSTTFVAGVDEAGVTQVQLFGSNSVTQTLPIELEVNIVENHQIFFQVLPEGAESVSVEARVDIDGRVQVDDSGTILAVDPWRFVYVFNRPLTRTIEVVI